MKETPILFTSEMVRAILEGRKTQTRRLIKPQPTMMERGWMWVCKKLDAGYAHTDESALRTLMIRHNPWGEPGDILWGKETFGYGPSAELLRDRVLHYRADGKAEKLVSKWKPSIFMPRKVCRLTLEISKLNVERLQDITEADAKAEGSPEPTGRNGCYPAPWATAKPGPTTYRESYQRLWDSINAKKAPWKSNPWVWAITFNPK